MEKKTKRTNRLGRGLSALIPELNEDLNLNEKDIVSIDLEKIYPNDTQPRKVFDQEKIEVLSESIKNHGVLQPIVVKPDDENKYMIIAGERRYRASKLAKKKDIPAIIKDIPMKSVMEIALIENLQRENLNSIEEAVAYKSLIENYDVTQEEISEAVGKSRPHITNTLRLLNLAEEVRNMIDESQITAGHGKALLKIVDHEIQIKLAERIVEEELSVREIEAITKKILEGKEDDSAKKTKKEKDIYIVDAEDKLRNVFGTKVNISQGKRKGKIEIEYYNDEDLNNIISLIME